MCSSFHDVKIEFNTFFFILQHLFEYHLHPEFPLSLKWCRQFEIKVSHRNHVERFNWLLIKKSYELCINYQIFFKYKSKSWVLLLTPAGIGHLCSNWFVTRNQGSFSSWKTKQKSAICLFISPFAHFPRMKRWLDIVIAHGLLICLLNFMLPLRYVC